MSIIFESDTVAHARSGLFAVCGLDPGDIGNNFAEGGYYYWSFCKEMDEAGVESWKISYLCLDVLWEQGESKGLNQELYPVVAEEKQSVVVTELAIELGLAETAVLR
jgi:hypothetical protein